MPIGYVNDLFCEMGLFPWAVLSKSREEKQGIKWRTFARSGEILGWPGEEGTEEVYGSLAGRWHRFTEITGTWISGQHKELSNSK